jgi:hypothetical protein
MYDYCELLQVKHCLTVSVQRWFNINSSLEFELKKHLTNKKKVLLDGFIVVYFLKLPVTYIQQLNQY